MSYTVTLTRSGQMTLPKHFRDFIFVKNGERVDLDTKEDYITIRRQKSLREKLKEMDAKRTPEQLASIAKHRGKTAHQMMDEYWNSPEGEAELRKINYGN